MSYADKRYEGHPLARRNCPHCKRVVKYRVGDDKSLDFWRVIHHCDGCVMDIIPDADGKADGFSVHYLIGPTK